MNPDLEKMVPEGHAILPDDVGITDMAVAYVEALLDDKPTKNPLWTTRVKLHDGRWIEVRFNVEHEWIESPLADKGKTQ